MHVRLAECFVLIMVVVSAAFNFSFGWRLGSNSHTVMPYIHDGWIYGALSIAADGFKIVLGVLCVKFFLAWHMKIWMRSLGAVLCGILFVAAALYSVNSAIGSISMNRTDMAGIREAKATNYHSVRIQLDRVEKEQSWLDQEYRAAAAIEADLAGLRQSPLWSRTSACTDATVPESRAFCQGYSALNAELGTSRRAEDLAARAETLRNQLAGLGGAIIADPHAEMLHQLTGYDQKVIVLAWLLLVVALVEGGSTLGPIGLWLARMSHQKPQEAAIAVVPAEDTDTPPAAKEAVTEPEVVPDVPEPLTPRETVMVPFPKEPRTISTAHLRKIAGIERPKLAAARVEPEEPVALASAIEPPPIAKPKKEGKTKAWLGDCCSQDASREKSTTINECYESYQAWCQLYGFYAISKRALSREMAAQLKLPPSKSGKRNGAGRVFEGLMVWMPDVNARKKAA